MNQKRALRQTLRRTRQQLAMSAQNCASQKLGLALHRIVQQHARQIRRTKSLKIGMYTANDGEISLDPFIKRSKCSTSSPQPHFFFPIIQSDKTLTFGRRTRGGLPKTNQYKIKEPLKQQCQTINQLDIIILPLVAITLKGVRLGMGGGFYDRTLIKLSRWRPKPLLIGVAHDFQIVPETPSDDWDQPVDVICTDRRVVYSRSRY